MSDNDRKLSDELALLNALDCFREIKALALEVGNNMPENEARVALRNMPIILERAERGISLMYERVNGAPYLEDEYFRSDLDRTRRWTEEAIELLKR